MQFLRKQLAREGRVGDSETGSHVQLNMGSCTTMIGTQQKSSEEWTDHERNKGRKTSELQKGTRRTAGGMAQRSNVQERHLGQVWQQEIERIARYMADSESSVEACTGKRQEGTRAGCGSCTYREQART